ncbi:MAG: hypothetical protein LBN98_02710 [Prevotellaceae bacterium]|jgi:hypothetical protein|nr:hypothetical protein [Prevotellaceae bacterium]
MSRIFAIIGKMRTFVKIIYNVETTPTIRTGIRGTLHPQFITDTAGAKLVILPQQEFEGILESIEDWEDNLLLAKAKADDTGERIPMEEAFSMIETGRKKAQA